jgi:hypothetical protein
MMVPYRARPGLGFVIVVLGALGALGFSLWGLATPPLESAWRLQIELMVGRREPLRKDELRLLQRMLVKEDKLADDMLRGAPAGLISANARGFVENGYAYVVRRSPDTPSALVVTPAGLAVNQDVEVHVRVATGDVSSGTATKDAPFATKLPQDGSFPQLIEVRVGSEKQADKGKSPPVNVQLENPK